MTSRILLRRGTAAQWSSANPILGTGELGVETDTLKFKIGNGTSTWTQLTSYANITPSDLTSAINGLINAAPSALDTLNELAAAINNDSSFSTTVNNLLNGKVSKSGGDTITASSASTKGLIIRGADSQTANLTEWQDNTGIVKAYITSSGEVRTPFLGSTSTGKALLYTAASATGEFRIDTNVAANKGLVVRGAPSQTANLQEWQNSAGTALSAVTSSGRIWATSMTVAANGGSTTGSQFGVAISSASSIGLVIKGAASQTANLQEWQDSAGTVLANIFADGDIGINSIRSVNGSVKRILMNQTTESVRVTTATAAYIGLVIRGVSGQTADLQQWQDSEGTVLSEIDAAGAANFVRAGIGGITPSTTPLFVTSPNASYIATIIRGASGQSANLQEWQDSAGTIIARITNIGGLYVNSNISQNSSGRTFLGGTGDHNAFLNVSIPTASRQGIVVRANASQTANLQEWQNSSGTVLARVSSGGAIVTSGVGVFGAQSNVSNAQLAVVANSTTNPTVVIKGVASQTSNLQEWQNSAGTVLASVTDSGVLRVTTSTYSPYLQDTSGSSNAYIQMTGSTVKVTGAASYVPLTVQGAASQTASLQEWQNSSGTILASIVDTGFSAAILKIPYIYTYTIQGWNGVGGSIEFANATPITIKPQSASVVNLVIKGAASQTANLQEWQDSTGAVKMSINQYGSIVASAGGTYISTFGDALFGARNATTIPLTVKSAASQTVNLTEWQNSAGGVLASIDSNGIFNALNAGSGVSSYSSILIGGRWIRNERRSGLTRFGVSTGEWHMSTDPDNSAIAITDSQVGVFATSTTLPLFTVKGMASQTANLQEWQDSAGSVLTKVASDGTIVAYGSNLNAFHSIGTSTTTYNGITVQNSTSGSAFTLGTAGASETAFSVANSFYIYDGIAGLMRLHLNSSGLVGINAVPTSQLQVNNSTAANVGLIVKGSASQTANLQEWQDSTGGVLSYITASGALRVNSSFGGTQAAITAGSAATVGVIVRGAASQTANLQEWQNSAGSNIASINTSGGIVATQARINTSSFLGYVSIVSTAPANIGAVIRGAASQTANLQEWQTSAGTVLAKVASSGKLVVAADSEIPSATILTSTAVAGGANVTPSSTANDYSIALSASGGSTGSTVGMAFQVWGGLGFNGVYQPGAGIWFTRTGGYSSGYLVLATRESSTPVTTVVERMRIGETGTITIAGFTASSIGLIVKAASSQTADLQQWQNSAGTVLARIASDGQVVTSQQITANAGLDVVGGGNALRSIAGAATVIPIVAKGFASQTADLQQWQDSAGTVLGSIGSGGAFDFQVGGHAITSYNTGQIMMRMFAPSGQTANIQNWYVNNAIVASINSSGNIYTSNGFTTPADLRVANGLISYGYDNTYSARISVVAGSPTNQTTLIVKKKNSTETGNFQEWQNSAGTVLAYIDKDGQILTPRVNLPGNGLIVEGGTGPYIQMGTSATYLYTRSASNKGLIVKGAASQTADLQQWQNSSGAVLAEITSSGSLELNGKDIELMNIMGAF